MTTENRTHLAAVAADTLHIIERGGYEHAAGPVSLRASIDAALAATTLHSPEALAALAEAAERLRSKGPPRRPEVTGETTLAAARRLTAKGANVVALNFASARSVGGGFLGGARAQEESLCRASALYPTLLTAPRYYDENRAADDTLYTDWAIHSPNVPVFRDDALALLAEPFHTSFITLPAPNLRPENRPPPEAVASTFRRRIRYLFALAREKGHDALVLGAWGCGAFRNEPTDVANAFHQALHLDQWSASFRHITFAIHDGKAEGNLPIFQRTLDRPT